MKEGGRDLKLSSISLEVREPTNYDTNKDVFPTTEEHMLWRGIQEL